MSYWILNEASDMAFTVAPPRDYPVKVDLAGAHIEHTGNDSCLAHLGRLRQQGHSRNTGGLEMIPQKKMKWDAGF